MLPMQFNVVIINTVCCGGITIHNLLPRQYMRVKFLADFTAVSVVKSLVNE